MAQDQYGRTFSVTTTNGRDVYTVTNADASNFVVSFPAGTALLRVLYCINSLPAGNFLAPFGFSQNNFLLNPAQRNNSYSDNISNYITGDGLTTTRHASNLPNWLSFNEYNGDFIGQPKVIDVGLYTGINFTITGSDGRSASATGSILVV